VNGPPNVDGGRLLAHIEELRQIGRTDSGGVSRLAFTPEEREGRELVAGWMREAGLEPEVDAAANLIGRRAGDEDLPAIVLGSHLDTVVEGGAYDGAYGVLAAVEVAHTLARTDLRHPLAVVAFNDEEGAFRTRGMWGAHAVAGALEPNDLSTPDERGIPVAELLANAGGDPDRVLTDAAWAPGSIAAYLELHIEQGPVLEREGIPIGVVEAVTGRANADVIVEGEANHAGATPMADRRDALLAAAQVILAVPGLTGDDGVRVATTGTCVVEPGVWNVVPGRVRLGVELRDVDDTRIADGLERLAAAAERIGTVTGTRIRVEPGPSVEAAPCDPGLRAVISEAAASLGLATMVLPSGAGHDAQVVARVAPIGMIFVPSRAGISHAPAEATDDEDLVAGADVLLRALLARDSHRIRLA
jgi:hydantoinase/carbamoylase family amidase